MKIRLALIFFASTLALGASAQSFEQLENFRGDNTFFDNGFEVLIRRTQVAAKYTEAYGGTTFNIRFRNEDYSKGGTRYHFENPTLGDMLFVVARLLRGKNDNMKTEQSFGSGFFGWHQLCWNSVATDRLLISPGISFGDYIYSSRRAELVPGTQAQITDPAGYFFHAGPALMITPLIGNEFWLDATIRYDLTARAGKPSGNYQALEGAKKPHFLGVITSFHHARSRLFAAVNYTQMIDRGPAKDAASRVDISVGYSF